MIEQLERLVSDYLPEPWMRALAILGIAVVVGLAARWILTSVLSQLTKRSGTDLDDEILRILARPIFMSIVLVGIFLAAKALEISDPAALFVKRTTQTLGLIVWLSAILRACRPLLDSFSRLADRVQWIESRTVPLIDNFGRVMLFVAAVYLLLKIWSLDVTPWLASAGVVGLALGLAAKDSLANLFGGLFIIADAPYKLRDYINLDTGERGEVTKIGLRSTRLLTRDDTEITIPNAQIAAAKILNEAGGRWEKSRIRIKVGVAYGSNVAQVKQVLMAAAEAVEFSLDEPEPRVRFRELGDSALNFELLVWIATPELRGRCVDALLTRVYESLGEAGIGIPFPQREVHLAQPLRVEVVPPGSQ